MAVSLHFFGEDLSFSTFLRYGRCSNTGTTCLVVICLVARVYVQISSADSGDLNPLIHLEGCTVKL